MSPVTTSKVNAPRPAHRGAARVAPPSTLTHAGNASSADSTPRFSPSFTVVTQGSDRVVHVHEGDRTSSGGSASRSTASSGGSRSLSSEESWSDVAYEDDIDPSDSASRSRQPATRRHTVEARPAPKRRHSSRRVIEHEEAPPRHHPSRRHHTSRHESRHESGSRPARSTSRRVRVPSDDSSSTVASADDYPYGQMPRAAYPPMPGHRQPPPQGPPGYPPSMTSAGQYPDPYGHPQSALVHMRHDPFGYPAPQHGNPFSPAAQQQSNPFSPLGSNESSQYFGADPMGPPPPRHQRPDAPQRPQSFAAPSHYGSELMSPYHPGMPGYPPYGMPGYPPYPSMQHAWPPSAGSSPPPESKNGDRTLAEIEAMKAQFQELIKKRDAEDAASVEKVKKDAKSAEIESLKELIKKHQEEAVAQQKAWVAERVAEAAARAAEKAKAEEEVRRKKEIEEAKKVAKEAAEKKAEEAAKKAKEEHEKKLAEAAKAKEDAEKEHVKKLAEAAKAKEEVDKAKKDLEEEIKKNKPTADELKPPIKFKDAVGRKFSFPWRLCKTWKGMEALIKQAFMHIDTIGDHVHQGHYDLTGPDGEIILPQVWDTMIQPDWEITMHLWPMEEEKKKKHKEVDPMMGLHDPFANLGLGGFPGMGDFGMLPPDRPKKAGKKDGAKKKKGSPDFMHAQPMMPPPVGPPMGPPMGPPGGPMGPPPGAFGDPFGNLGPFGGLPPGISVVPDKKDKGKARTKSKGGKEISGFAAWLAGGNVKPVKKR